MAERFDVVVVGAGPGGYTAAIRAAQLGLRAAVVEKEAVGGLCLNWGCIPSKALLHCAEFLETARRGADFGISLTGLSADLGAAVDRSREIVAKFVAGVETLLQQNGVELLRGRARLAGAGAVRLEPGGETLEAANVIIATGGVARSLPGVEPDGERVITSREALFLRRPPASVVIVGGGAVGCEFAYLFRAFGSEVTVIEILPRLLPNEDEDVSRELARSFAAKGIGVWTGAAVEAVTKGADGVSVRLTVDGRPEELRAERLLLGVGLAANTEGLGLEEAGVELERGWVKVDEFCRTTAPGVWAIGDVTGKLALAHVASHQGVVAVEKMAGREPPPLDYDRMPRAVFCQPQVASLGLSEAQARQRGYDVRTGRFPFRASGKAMVAGETEGFVKLVVDAATNGVLGWHVIGHGVAEMLGEASLGSALETTTAELGYAVHAHPTLSEALKEAALAVRGEAVHFYTPKRE